MSELLKDLLEESLEDFLEAHYESMEKLKGKLWWITCKKLRIIHEATFQEVSLDEFWVESLEEISGIIISRGLPVEISETIIEEIVVV